MVRFTQEHSNRLILGNNIQDIINLWELIPHFINAVLDLVMISIMLSSMGNVMYTVGFAIESQHCPNAKDARSFVSGRISLFVSYIKHLTMRLLL